MELLDDDTSDDQVLEAPQSPLFTAFINDDFQVR